MKRKAVIFQTSSDGKWSVAVDATNALTILAYVTQDARHEKKFRHIVELILNGLRNTELYDKENINDRTGNVTAMKLFKGQENAGTPDRPNLLSGVHHRGQDVCGRSR